MTQQEEPTLDVHAIRELLAEAFTAGELREFCEDHSLFEQVVNRFRPSQGLESMVDVVVAYAQRWDLFAELLSGIAHTRPRVFRRHLPSIVGFPGARTDAAGALLTMAQVFLDKHAYADALPLIRTALDVDPGNQRARARLLYAAYQEAAHLYGTHRDLQGARRALEEVLAQNPSHERAQQLLYEVEHELDVRASVERRRRRIVPGWAWLGIVLGTLVIGGLALLLAFGLDGGEIAQATATATAARSADGTPPPPTPEPTSGPTRSPSTTTEAPPPTQPPTTEVPPVADSPTALPTDTPGPTATREPSATSTPLPTATPSDTPTPIPSPTAQPQPTAIPTRRPTPSPTRRPSATWFWRDWGPFRAENGVMGFVNYTDEPLTVRMFDFHSGLTHRYEVPAESGSVRAVELAPGNYAIHARTPTTPGIYVAVLPTFFRGEGWYCEILDSLRVYKRRALVMAFAIKRGTPQNPEERRLDLAGCPWLEEERIP